MWFAPESADEDHDIHPRYCRPNDGEWLDTRTRERDEIVPVTESRDELSDPLDSWLDPLRFRKRENEQTQREDREKYGDRLGDEYEKSFYS